MCMKLNRIKEVLEDKGITQTWLAKKLGKSFSIVNAYACNRQQPPLETLFEIAEILGVGTEDLLIKNNKK
ncbi:helix-turn-helix transcriptional regulator [Bacteroides sp. ZJ-18]|nr:MULTISPECIES: helix-turn-helix transcriptional regulator [unclassified Bacteroides]QTO27846.1 helix-turn-helix transcriptional regulator [Bacteroides sp. ZJ-18]